MEWDRVHVSPLVGVKGQPYIVTLPVFSLYRPVIRYERRGSLLDHLTGHAPPPTYEPVYAPERTERVLLIHPAEIEREGSL